MRVFKVKHYTLSKGKDPNGEVGNIRQTTETTYIQCQNTCCVEVLLEKYYEKPMRSGAYFVPVIESIEAIDGFCLIEEIQ